MVEYFLKTQPEDVDEVLVNSLLDVFCKLGDMPRLEASGAAWEEMQAEGLEANAVTYGCMLDACVKCGHLEKALHIFAIMKQRGLHRNTILYATLIKARPVPVEANEDLRTALSDAQGFAKSKDPLAAKNLYREMRAERVPRGCPGRGPAASAAQRPVGELRRRCRGVVVDMGHEGLMILWKEKWVDNQQGCSRNE
eukprot:Skav224505  [mRNA]  locus=scaffold3754:68813:74478:- [translate_table: standard]